MIQSLRGIMPALVTPMAPNGSVDLATMRRLVERLIGAGVHGLVVLGGTGEYLALSPDERVLVIEGVVDAARGRVPVIAGVLEPGIRPAVASAQRAHGAGADAVMVVTPYYAAPTQQGLVDYFVAIADELPLPVMAYNIPSRTGVNLRPETFVEMVSRRSSIVGIKECASAEQGLRLLNIVPPHVAVLAGEEASALQMLTSGAAGAILASANAIPWVWLEIHRLVQNGRPAEAAQRFETIRPLLDALFAETNPGPLKAALELLGHPVGDPRLPLLRTSPQLRARLDRELSAIGEATMGRT